MGLDPITKEGFLARAVARGTCAISPVIEFLTTVVKDFDNYAVASRGIGAVWAR